MFSFESIKKLFKYNWKEIGKKAVPKGNSKEMSETSYKNIFNGAILMILAVVVQYTIFVIFVNDWFGYYSGSLIGYWLRYTISYAALPIAILVYNQVMKGKAHNSYVIFIIGAICAVEMVSSVYYIFDNIDVIGLFPLIFVGSLCRAGLTFLGASHATLGALEFSEEAVSAYNAANPNAVGSYQPTAPTTPQAPTEPAPTTPTPQAPTESTPTEPTSRG